jgi:hypothetical protein
VKAGAKRKRYQPVPELGLGGSDSMGADEQNVPGTLSTSLSVSLCSVFKMFRMALLPGAVTT